MTPDEAKASLSLCPPEDPTNPYVPRLGEAQELVASNAELAAWWEAEKNFDLQFSQKLQSLRPPPELGPAVMRGGATIFFASRLIAETTGEEAAEAQPLPDLPAGPRRIPEVSLASTRTDRDFDDETDKLAKRWIWRMGLVMVGVIGVLALVFLFSFEYELASKEQAQDHYTPGTQLEALVTIAAALPSTATATAAASTPLTDMQRFLAEHHAPNPAELPGIIRQPPAGTVISVSTETWNYIPVSCFTLQSGENLQYLIIIDTKDLNEAPPLDNYTTIHGEFYVRMLGSNGYLYMELQPTTPKT